MDTSLWPGTNRWLGSHANRPQERVPTTTRNTDGWLARVPLQLVHGGHQLGQPRLSRSDVLAQLRDAIPAILPSLLQCDFGNLAAEVRRLEAAGVPALHLDVMDGHFVPNLTYGMPLVASLRDLTALPLDVHLMISDPERYLDAFYAAGADLVTFHIEAVPHPEEVLQKIHRLGMAAGLAINPETPVSSIEPWLNSCDLVLVMSVRPGFGGQTFQEIALSKLQQLRQVGPESLLLGVDGGIKQENIASCGAAGGQLFVVGSAIFGEPEYDTAIRQFEARASSS
ncbi:MAG: ribulose-phosphate 3-epimerase [Planctomycetaceae bacterium]|nr:ribulose-phosphate 3-epimerase [Planctomycetaceae bacterium]